MYEKNYATGKRHFTLFQLVRHLYCWEVQWFSFLKHFVSRIGLKMKENKEPFEKYIVYQMYNMVSFLQNESGAVSRPPIRFM